MHLLACAQVQLRLSELVANIEPRLRILEFANVRSLACAQVYLSLSELIANGGSLERATAGAAAAIDSLSGEAAKAVKQLRKSLTAVVRKSSNSATKAQPSDAIAALSDNRQAPILRAR